MKRAKLAGLALGSIAILMLGACASGDNGVSDPVPGCPDGVVTLSVLRAEGSFPNDDQLDGYKSVNKCVDFKVTEVPFGQLAEKISILAPSKNAPDIIGSDAPNTWSYASQGLILPVDKYLPADWATDVLSATRAENTYKGKVYSPGLQQNALIMFYNKDMTDKAGITVPSTLDTAWTWPQALEAFTTCQADNPGVLGLAPSFLGGGTPGFAYRDLLFQRSAGDPTAPKSSSSYKTYWALSPDGKTIDGWLNTPEAIKADEFYQSLFNGPGAVTSKEGLPNALVDGKACFDLSIGLQTAKTTFAMGVTPVPYFTTPIVHTGGINLVVTAKSAHADVAAKAVVAMSTGDLLLEWAKATKRIPTLKSIIAKIPELQSGANKLISEEIDQWGQPRPPSAHFTEYDQIVSSALRDIAQGADAKDALDGAVDQLTPLLAR